MSGSFSTIAHITLYEDTTEEFRQVMRNYAADKKESEEKQKTKRPPGNRAASSSRENSSNGGLDSVKTFCRNLMSQKTGVSSDFWEINASVINNLQNGLTFPKTVAF
jgi:hypothetical protein